MVTNEVEIRITSKDASALGFDAAKARVADLKERIRDLSRQKIQIDADIDAARGRIEALKAELRSGTGRAKVEIDADIAAATAKIAELQQSARSLSRQRMTLQLDASQAQAQLAAFDGSLNEVDGKTAHANVDVDIGAALSKIGLVAAALAALSAAAAGVGAALGAGAVAGVGIGAAVAGLSGVGAAVKALGDQTKAAGGSAGGAAGKELQLASALDRVKGAQAALANTRAEVADSERRALERVQEAQEDLTSARADAARQLEDLTRREQDLALAQRGAALDVEEAQLRLLETLGDNRATDLQRRQAQLAYDEAVHQQQDLARQAGETAKAKAAADRVGVAGSHEVIEAQRRLKDAQAANVAAQRQGAYQITQAQQAVVEAQRAVQQASMAAGGGGAAAINKLNDAMANLSPAGQSFARFMRSFIDGPIKDLRFAAQQGFLPPLQKALGALGPVIEKNLPAFQRFANVLGQAFGGIINIAGRLLPIFLRFATVVLQSLSPLEGVFIRFGDALGKVLDQMISNGSLQKVMDDLVKLIDGLLRSVVALLPQFMDLAVQVLPPLIAAALALVPVIAALAKAMGPVLIGVLHALTPLLLWLGQWMTDHVEATTTIITLFIAAAAAAKVWAIAQTTLYVALVLFTTPIGLIIVALGGLVAAFIWAWKHSETFRDIVRTTMAVAKRAVDLVVGAFKAAVGAVAAVIGVLGRIAGIVGGVVGALGKIRLAVELVGGAFKTARDHMVDFILTQTSIFGGGSGGSPFVVGAGQPGGGGSGGSGGTGNSARPARASGGIAGGLVEVGEHGRELVRLPYGSTVVNSNTADNMLAGARGGVGAVYLEWTGGTGDELFEWIRRNVRIRGGGNVQAALGR